MNRRHASVVVAMVVALLMSTIAVGTELESPAVTPRAMAHCMMKRLRANNTESYRDAFKACKEKFATAQADRSTETAMTTAAANEEATHDEATKQRP
jgi:hypothetical protein